VSEPGNLYASLLLTDAAAPAAISGLCFVAALAVHDALLDAVHGLAPAQLKLKWPNDVLLDGKKIVGILVEGASPVGGSSVAVVGIGVNCRHHPEQSELASDDLASAGFTVSPGALLGGLGRAMSARLREWDRGNNFAAIRTAWIARAGGIGAPIEVRLPGRTMSGTFETLDATGALVLKHGNGTQETIAAGDVFPMAPQ
jgi:BirA family biotin operon repressor/biotin-[acetyl-CoA-carboxylase] ligase